MPIRKPTSALTRTVLSTSMAGTAERARDLAVGGAAPGPRGRG
jgi:hypothetical protein